MPHLEMTRFQTRTRVTVAAGLWLSFFFDDFHYFAGHSMKHNQPDFITPLRNLTVEVGRNATFECFVTGIKKFRVSTHYSSQFLNGTF